MMASDDGLDIGDGMILYTGASSVQFLSFFFANLGAVFLYLRVGCRALAL